MTNAALEIRKAVAADVPAIRACVDTAYALYVDRIGKKPAPMLSDHGQQVADGLVSVAVLDGEIVGSIVMWPEDDHFYVDSIAVDPARQGTGLGAALLDHADAEAAAADRTEIRLYTNVSMVENLDYYPRRGFTETHRGSDEGYERVYYRRPVPLGEGEV